MVMKGSRLSILFSLLLIFSLFSAAGELAPIKQNPWELIIYRPENKTDFNYVRCYLRIEDENGNDVSKSKVSASYEWATIPNVANKYKNILYLDGGMAMHLHLQAGKYRFSVFTPTDKQNFPCKNKDQWESNVFEYDTENPAKVIFVTPVMNDNGFFRGEWWIDYRTPKFFKWSQMKIRE